MLTSLFGDLGPALHPQSPEDAARAASRPAALGFVQARWVESTAVEVDADGKLIDRRVHDLIVTGSPAQAMRSHFAGAPAESGATSRMLTLLDPTGLWASAVIKAISDATGHAVERLHLREEPTLRSLATIERTPLIRADTDPMRVWHAQPLASGVETDEIQIALIERSDLTAVFIGLMEPAQIDALLEALQQAARLPTWRCPAVLFVLPPSAVWVANKIAAIGWPADLRLDTIGDQLTSASEVWNVLLGAWQRLVPAHAPLLQVEPALAPEPAYARTIAGHAAFAADRVGLRLDPATARRALGELLSLAGLLGCAVVDSASGHVVARETREDHPVDLDLAAATSAQIRRVYSQAARSLGLAEPAEEVIISSALRYHVMRWIAGYPGVFLFALLDRQRANLSAVRQRLQEVDKSLG